MRVVVPVYKRAVVSGGERPSQADKTGAEDTETESRRESERSPDGEDAKAKAKDKAEDKKIGTDKSKKCQGRPRARGERPSRPPEKAASSPPRQGRARETGRSRQEAGNRYRPPTGNVDPKRARRRPREQADASGATPEFRWPARGRIIEGFKSGGNDGINISVPTGTSVRAAENGVVVYSGDGLKGYGNLVLIKHPNGFVTAYANNGELDVKRGETVKRGQIIAKSGDSAMSTRRNSISNCARDRPRSIRPAISPAFRDRTGLMRFSPRPDGRGPSRIFSPHL